MADLQRTVYPHSGHPSSEGRAQDSVSSPAKDRRSANCATQPTYATLSVKFLRANGTLRHSFNNRKPVLNVTNKIDAMLNTTVCQTDRLHLGCVNLVIAAG